MKVILTTDIKGVGRAGDEVNVAPGYWSNFLLPKGFAVLPTDPEAKQLIAKQIAMKQKQEAEVVNIRDLATTLNGKKVELSAKASKRGKLGGGQRPALASADKKLFGAVREADIAEKLGIDKKLITMEPIKTIGEHQVLLTLPHGHQATITVTIEAE